MYPSGLCRVIEEVLQIESSIAVISPRRAPKLHDIVREWSQAIQEGEKSVVRLESLLLAMRWRHVR